MQYFSPSRPTLHGRAQLLSPSGRAIAPLPTLSLHPLEEPLGHYEIGCFLIVAPMSASWHSIDVEGLEIPDLLSAWTQDPEAFLRYHFDYSYEPPRGHSPHPRPLGLSAPAPRAITLSDLGLS